MIAAARLETSTSSPSASPNYWRNRAAQARAQASQMTTPKARERVLDLAKQYEKIAEQQESLLFTKPKPPI